MKYYYLITKVYGDGLASYEEKATTLKEAKRIYRLFIKKEKESIQSDYNFMKNFCRRYDYRYHEYRGLIEFSIDKVNEEEGSIINKEYKRMEF